jgi:hypothetical protein
MCVCVICVSMYMLIHSPPPFHNAHTHIHVHQAIVDEEHTFLAELQHDGEKIKEGSKVRWYI